MRTCLRLAAARRSRPAGEVLWYSLTSLREMSKSPFGTSAGPEESTQRRGPQYDLTGTTCKRVRLLTVGCRSKERDSLVKLWQLNPLRATAHFRLFGSRSHSPGHTRATSSQQPPRASCHVSQPDRIQALCFGYFHLGQQMKVTRPPGRNPAGCRSTAGCRTGNQPLTQREKHEWTPNKSSPSASKASTSC